MATKTIYLSGVCEWANHLREPDVKFNADGVYVVDLFLDEASWERFDESGMQLKVREKNGQKFVKLKRPAKKTIKGDVIEMGPPSIKDAHGETFDDPPLIGNGSTITCKVSVYDTKKGKGHTLEAVRVDELVVYDAIDGDADAF